MDSCAAISLSESTLGSNDDQPTTAPQLSCCLQNLCQAIIHRRLRVKGCALFWDSIRAVDNFVASFRPAPYALRASGVRLIIMKYWYSRGLNLERCYATASNIGHQARVRLSCPRLVSRTSHQLDCR